MVWGCFWYNLLVKVDSSITVQKGAYSYCQKGLRLSVLSEYSDELYYTESLIIRKCL